MAILHLLGEKAIFNNSFGFQKPEHAIVKARFVFGKKMEDLLNPSAQHQVFAKAAFGKI